MDWIVDKEAPGYRFKTNLRSTSATQLVFGKCDFTKKEIQINKHLYERRFDFWHLYLDVLFHEIAHAKAGLRAGHGPGWRRVYQHLLREYDVDSFELEDEKERFYSEVIIPIQSTRAKTIMRCPSCNRIFYFQRKVTSSYNCGHCNISLRKLPTNRTSGR